MLKIAFLCSGGGGNLRFIHEAIQVGWLADAEICAVITDRACGASDFARANKMWCVQIDFSQPQQTILLHDLDRVQPDLVITNVHKVLVPTVVQRYAGKLLNLHYSLLPSFGGVIGTRPVSMALEYGAKFVGATAHLVDEGVDTGQPVVQAAIPVTGEDATESLMDVVFRSGCICLLNAIEIVRRDRYSLSLDTPRTDTALCVDVVDRYVLLSPAAIRDVSYSEEGFWRRVRGSTPTET
jgi:phosphoribosylglycinamide formyltransferase-1